MTAALESRICANLMILESPIGTWNQSIAGSDESVRKKRKEIRGDANGEVSNESYSGRSSEYRRFSASSNRIQIIQNVDNIANIDWPGNHSLFWLLSRFEQTSRRLTDGDSWNWEHVCELEKGRGWNWYSQRNRSCVKARLQSGVNAMQKSRNQTGKKK
jgi:hypothetical protein